ncbi:hypothetical protein OAI47_01810 [Rhodospirillaceae bacterium]|nr:hypothetical protein [Rhodospirillaceae bacterium]
MANFCTISRAKPKAGYAATAIEKLKTLSEFSKANGAIHADIGAVQTGLNVGSILAIQFFEKMADIEKVYDKMPTQPVYEELFSTGNMELTGRGIARILHREAGSSVDAKYMVLTKFSSETEMLDEAKKVMGIFMANGALSCGYATIGAGHSVGDRLMGVRYPSLDAIQKAYEVARENTDYKSALSNAEVHFRNVLRLA